jgi:hypothetical protein
MKYLRTYEDFRINENVFKDLMGKISGKLKTLRGKAFIKLIRTILPKSILSEIDKMVGTNESYILLELFDYSGDIDWEKMSEDEVDNFLKYISKNSNFISSVKNPDKILSTSGNSNIILETLKERGIDVPVQVINKNTPNIKNLFNKVDGLKIPTFVKGFLKVTACLVLLGMISFKVTSAVSSSDGDFISDTDTDTDSSFSDFSELEAAAEKIGINVEDIEDKIITKDKNFFEKIVEWIYNFFKGKSGPFEIENATNAMYKRWLEAESNGLEDFEPFIEETKNMVKAQVSVDKNIPDNVKKSLYDKIDKCKPVFLDEDYYNSVVNTPSYGVYWNYKDHDFIFINFNLGKLDDYRRTLIHELFHLVDFREDGKFGVSDKLIGEGFWDFLNIDIYDDDDEYNKNYKNIFGNVPDWKYDKDYLVGQEFSKEGENLPLHEIYTMLKVMKNDLVNIGLLNRIEDPVPPKLIGEILNGEHKDKLNKIKGQWIKILPIIRTDKYSIGKFSDFLSHVVDDLNKYDNMA